jgi:hypothetical protein
MTPTNTLEAALTTPQYDNSGLRARLSGSVVTHRQIATELRAAMNERLHGEHGSPSADERWS